MLGYPMLGESNLKRPANFFDALLEPLGLCSTKFTKVYIGYATKKTHLRLSFMQHFQSTKSEPNRAMGQ